MQKPAVPVDFSSPAQLPDDKEKLKDMYFAVKEAWRKNRREWALKLEWICEKRIPLFEDPKCNECLSCWLSISQARRHRYGCHDKKAIQCYLNGILPHLERDKGMDFFFYLTNDPWLLWNCLDEVWALVLDLYEKEPGPDYYYGLELLLAMYLGCYEPDPDYEPSLVCYNTYEEDLIMFSRKKPYTDQAKQKLAVHGSYFFLIAAGKEQQAEAMALRREVRNTTREQWEKKLEARKKELWENFMRHVHPEWINPKDLYDFHVRYLFKAAYLEQGKPSSLVNLCSSYYGRAFIGAVLLYYGNPQGLDLIKDFANVRLSGNTVLSTYGASIRRFTLTNYEDGQLQVNPDVKKLFKTLCAFTNHIVSYDLYEPSDIENPYVEAIALSSKPLCQQLGMAYDPQKAVALLRSIPDCWDALDFADEIERNELQTGDILANSRELYKLSLPIEEKVRILTALYRHKPQEKDLFFICQALGYEPDLELFYALIPSFGKEGLGILLRGLLYYLKAHDQMSPQEQMEICSEILSQLESKKLKPWSADLSHLGLQYALLYLQTEVSGPQTEAFYDDLITALKKGDFLPLARRFIRVNYPVFWALMGAVIQVWKDAGDYCRLYDFFHTGDNRKIPELIDNDIAEEWLLIGVHLDDIDATWKWYGITGDEDDLDKLISMGSAEALRQKQRLTAMEEQRLLQKQMQEQRLRAQKEEEARSRMRLNIEVNERMANLALGGSGRSVEEMYVTGSLDPASYYLYEEWKERKIDKEIGR